MVVRKGVPSQHTPPLDGGVELVVIRKGVLLRHTPPLDGGVELVVMVHKYSETERRIYSELDLKNQTNLEK